MMEIEIRTSWDVGTLCHMIIAVFVCLFVASVTSAVLLVKAVFSCIDSVARFIVAHVTYRAPYAANDNNCHGAVIPEVSLPFGKSSLRQPPGFAGFDQPPLQDFFEGGEIFFAIYLFYSNPENYSTSATKKNILSLSQRP